MFGRSDGKRVKSLSPIGRLTPYIMNRRTDSELKYTKDYDCGILDKIIAEYPEKNLSYMVLLFAAVVRTLALRPKLNRFIMNCKIYKRNRIEGCLAVHKTFRGDGDETIVKFPFKGTENLFEVNDIMTGLINESVKDKKANKTDGLSSLFFVIPGFILKLVINFLKQLDRWGMLPKAVIEGSPFHTSFFITNLKSINMEAAYHHLYEFGTNGIFISLGKDGFKPFADKNGEIVSKKVVTLAYVVEERMCDGLYLSKSLKYIDKYLNDPYLLLEGLEEIILDN